MKKQLAIVALVSLVSGGVVVARDGGKGAPRSEAIVRAHLAKLQGGGVLTSQQNKDFIHHGQQIERERFVKTRLAVRARQQGKGVSPELAAAAAKEFHGKRVK